jgi:hypothetical protein
MRADAGAARRRPGGEGPVQDHHRRTGRAAGWLADREVTLVAMEATPACTGSPFTTPSKTVSSCGCATRINVKNVPGRKTDPLTGLI